MAKPVEPLMTGALLLKVGEDMLIRGTPNVLFRFEPQDAPYELMNETADTLIASIRPNSIAKGETFSGAIDNFRLRYVIRPRGAGDILDVTYTLIVETQN